MKEPHLCTHPSFFPPSLPPSLSTFLLFSSSPSLIVLPSHFHSPSFASPLFHPFRLPFFFCPSLLGLVPEPNLCQCFGPVLERIRVNWDRCLTSRKRDLGSARLGSVRRERGIFFLFLFGYIRAILGVRMVPIRAEKR